MIVAAAALLLGAPPAGAATAESVAAGYRRLVGPAGCDEDAAADAIIVCARRDDDRERLPLYRPERGARESARDPLAAAPDLSGSGGARWDCGPFAHQRRCAKADMVEAGYGNGGDPLTAAVRLFGAIVDPDGDRGTPPAAGPR